MDLIEAAPAARRRVRWLRSYAPAELCGLLAALLGYVLVRYATGHAAAAAYGATVGESLGFYGLLLRRTALRSLVVEFGPAEVLDSAFLRPACMAGAVALLGPVAGVLAGKLAADVAFYAPVIATYELQLRRRAGGSLTEVRGRAGAA